MLHRDQKMSGQDKKIIVIYGMFFARQIVATAKLAGSRGISFWIILFYFVYRSRRSSRLSFLRIPANIVSFKISCRNYCLCSDVKKLILYPNINILAECIIAPRMTVRVALPLIIKPLFQNFLQKLLLVFWRKKINIVS